MNIFDDKVCKIKIWISVMDSSCEAITALFAALHIF